MLLFNKYGFANCFNAKATYFSEEMTSFYTTLLLSPGQASHELPYSNHTASSDLISPFFQFRIQQINPKIPRFP